MTKCTSRDGLVHQVFMCNLDCVLTLCTDAPWWLLDDHVGADPRLVTRALDHDVVTCLGCAPGYVTA